MNRKLKKEILNNMGVILAILSAFLYAFNVIIEKKYLTDISSEMILFSMFLGGSFGLFVIYFCTKNKEKTDKNRITKKEIPYVIGLVISEVIATFLLIEAVKIVNASLVSLLASFEIVTTAIFAYFIFKDPIEKHEIISIILMLIGCAILNFKAGMFNTIGLGSLLVILACMSWGLENNITALISDKEPAFFTAIKCGAVSLIYLIIALIKGTFTISCPELIFYGFFTYGISILSYAVSTKYLGANKATIIFSFSPIFGVLLAVILYHETLTIPFLISLAIMVIAIFYLRPKQKDTN